MSKKVMLVIANYKDERQSIFDNQISPRNQEFADEHGYEYIVSKGGDIFRGNPTWWKFTIPVQMINEGVLRQEDTLLHLDADMVITRIGKDYPNDKTFAYSIDNGNTHCMGNYSLKINDWSVNMIRHILSEELWMKMQNDYHWSRFREQAAWYTLSGVCHHSWVPFLDMPNYGWHSHFTDETRYSVRELHERVHVLGPEWNTTLVNPQERYYIQPSDPSETIIRHFAGGQRWDVSDWIWA